MNQLVEKLIHNQDICYCYLFLNQKKNFHPKKKSKEELTLLFFKYDELLQKYSCCSISPIGFLLQIILKKINQFIKKKKGETERK